MLDQNDIDAVVISAADHVHALASVKAMRLGKHVYCEKPLGHSVYEARVVRETYLACKGKVATQMGTQIHSTENYRRVVELIRCGAIGPVREAHVWCARIGPGGGLPEGSHPVPEHLSWDLWLGPAPYRPYHPHYIHAPDSAKGNLTWNRYWISATGRSATWAATDRPALLGARSASPDDRRGDRLAGQPAYQSDVAHRDVGARGTRRHAPRQAHLVRRGQASRVPPGFDLTQWNIGVLFHR